MIFTSLQYLKQKRAFWSNKNNNHLHFCYNFVLQVGREGDIQPLVRPLSNVFSLSSERDLGSHDSFSLVKCCESLAFLVRDVAHITPYNFENCVHCIRTFVEASLDARKYLLQNNIFSFDYLLVNYFMIININLLLLR